MPAETRPWERSVVGKVAAILATFHKGSSYTMTEIAAASGLPPSTAHRLLRDLTAWNLLERASGGDYRLGLSMRMMATADGRGATIADLARLAVQDLSEVTGAEVRLGVLRNAVVAFMEKLPGRRPVYGFSPQALAPIHATAMGKVLLAFSPPELHNLLIQEGLKSYTPFTITAPDRLRQSLAMIRRTQLGVSRAELTLDRNAVAAPVFGPGGRIVAAIEVRIDDPSSDLRAVQPALTVAARSLTCQLALAQSQSPRARVSASTFKAPVGALRSVESE